MTGAGRRAAASAVAVLVLAGCTGGPPGEPRPTTAAPLPDLPTDATTELPAYGGPRGGGPVTQGPLTRVAATVDLTSATPGVFARVVAAVAAPDGAARVLLSPADRDRDQVLATVRSDGVVTGSVPLPRVEDVWGMHLLGDGSVAVTGQLAREGYGVRLVGPDGAVRTTVVHPATDDVRAATGRSALSGQTLHLALSVETGDGVRERLVAVDATGTVRDERDLADDVAAASHQPVGSQLAGLLPRPGGGATLVFDASPTAVAEDRIPTLLAYDGDLEPAGLPVRAAGLEEGAETQSVAATADGTVFLLVAVRDGSWVLAVPDGGGAGPVLAHLEDRVFGYALAVDPAQVWAVLPGPTGALPVDLTTGEPGRALTVDCGPRLDVRNLYPSPGGALMIGECDAPRADTQMLWFLAP